MSLPPEILLRTFGTETGEHELDGDVDAQLRLSCLGRPIFRGTAPSKEELTPFLRERIAHHVELYQSFIRPVMIEGRVFHHTPFLHHYRESPWCVLEYAAKGGERAIAALFRTSGSAPAEYVLKPRGLDLGRTYQVTLDNRGQSFRSSGIELARGGIEIRLERTMSSELVLFQAVAP